MRLVIEVEDGVRPHVLDCLMWDDATIGGLSRVADVVAANFSATNGQVMDVLLEACNRIAEAFPRRGPVTHDV